MQITIDTKDLEGHQLRGIAYILLRNITRLPPAAQTTRVEQVKALVCNLEREDIEAGELRDLIKQTEV